MHTHKNSISMFANAILTNSNVEREARWWGVLDIDDRYIKMINTDLTINNVRLYDL